MDAQWRLRLYRYFSRPAYAYFARSTELILKDSRVWLVAENKELSLKVDKMIILLIALSYSRFSLTWESRNKNGNLLKQKV